MPKFLSTTTKTKVSGKVVAVALGLAAIGGVAYIVINSIDLTKSSSGLPLNSSTTIVDIPKIPGGKDYGGCNLNRPVADFATNITGTPQDAYTLDGVANTSDVAWMKNALGISQQSTAATNTIPITDPINQNNRCYDINRDGVIDNTDLSLVQEYAFRSGQLYPDYKYLGLFFYRYYNPLGLFLYYYSPQDEIYRFENTSLDPGVDYPGISVSYAGSTLASNGIYYDYNYVASVKFEKLDDLARQSDIKKANHYLDLQKRQNPGVADSFSIATFFNNTPYIFFKQASLGVVNCSLVWLTKNYKDGRFVYVEIRNSYFNNSSPANPQACLGATGIRLMGKYLNIYPNELHN